MDEWLNNEPFESTKSDIIPWLGVSYRQWQIDFSEKFMRPTYGTDIFGRMLYDRIKPYADKEYEKVFISDSGFAAELKVLHEYFSPDDILLARIHRPGFDFTGDSRSYLRDVTKHEVDVYNDGTVDEYINKIKKLIDGFSKENR